MAASASEQQPPGALLGGCSACAGALSLSGCWHSAFPARHSACAATDSGSAAHIDPKRSCKPVLHDCCKRFSRLKRHAQNANVLPKQCVMCMCRPADGMASAASKLLPLQGQVLGRQLQLQFLLLSHVVLANHDCQLAIKGILHSSACLKL